MSDGPARSGPSAGIAPFAQRYRGALADANVRGGLLGFQRSWQGTRDAQMLALEAIAGRGFGALRDEFAAIKDRVLAEPARYVAQFRAHAEAAGAVVVEVGSAAEANGYIADLCRRRGITLAVKGKSMVSEEIGLNAALAAAGVEAVETDLGEWLLQLAGDRPSHLVMPAIHWRRGQVAALLSRTLGEPFDADDIPAMARSVRAALRERFLHAGLGLTGANALIAETGSVMLVTNEGNGRLTSSLPPLHVVTVGAEKIVPSLADAIRQVRLLARSATGQPISTYTTFISGPTAGHELHIVLIDNGRSALAADPALAPALRCIRCGACANVCPAYQVVGGHAFGHIYTGPIGLVTTAAHHGLAAAAGPQSLCLSCGACATVCPVAIPLPAQILEVRREAFARGRGARLRRLAWRAFASRPLVAVASRLLALAALPLRAGGFTRLPFGLARRHVSWRTPPAIPWRPARARAALRAARAPLAPTAASGRRVLLFLQCVADRLAPEVPVAAAALLRAAGAEVIVPPDQHCCGLPAFDAGDHDAARRMARATIEALDGTDDIVTAAPSCVVMMLHDYARLFAGDPAWQARALGLAGRVHDLAGYLAGPARLPAGTLAAGDRAPVTVHRFCQGSHLLHAEDRLERLIADLCGVEVVPLAEAEVCCGFGGATSLAAPELAAGVLARKLANVGASGARVLVTDNPGCVLHLRGGAHAAGLAIRTLHVAEYLAARLPAAHASASPRGAGER
ncbi:MAG: 4Fe-4S dicluster domain-containing protein [Dehalococcoidia bacterium]|nr:4Fe-4S dicluster domain-containing protein [Dehalococcoidia bacterium]